MGIVGVASSASEFCLRVIRFRSPLTIDTARYSTRRRITLCINGTNRTIEGFTGC